MLSLRARFSALSSLPRDAQLLLAMTTLFGFGYGGIGLMLRPLYVLRLGQGTAYYGLYSALGSFAFMAASLGAGWLGMRIGARQTMVWGAIGCLIGSAIMPFTEFFPTSLWQELPIASNLLLSGAWALVSVNTIPALVGVTSEHVHDRVIGLSTTLNALGVLFGNLVGGVLPRVYSQLLDSSAVNNDGFRLAISTALPFGLAMIVLLLKLPERPPERGIALLSEVPHSATPFLVIGLFSLFIPATSSAIGTFATPYFYQDLHLSTEIIGVVTTLSQGLAVLG
ncbi:MAG: MFS transporter, partial [Anaerolineales bacterium]